MRFPLAYILLSAPLLAGDFDDTAEHAHAMDVRTVQVDGYPVVTHYGKVRPDFADRAPNPYRNRTPLDGEWDFRFDPDGAGLSDHWATTTDMAGWVKVSVPHCWDMMSGGRFWDWSDRSYHNPPFYDGIAWYRRTFEAPTKGAPARRLEFLGVPHRVSVFLNGSLVASHEGGGQPFSIDVSGRIRTGSNVLAVRIIRLPNYRQKAGGDGFDEIESIHGPHPKAPDNWPYAGITRGVCLIDEDCAAIRKVLVRTDSASLHAAVCLSNEGTTPRTIVVSLDSPVIETVDHRKVTLPPGGMRVLRFSAKLVNNARRWSPDNPALHTLTASASEEGRRFDTLRTSFGIRDFRVDGGRFILNGSPVFLKGVAVYEEHCDRGAALTAEDHSKLFDLVRDTRANFVRLHVSERHPLAYDLADQRGIMLCAEWGGFWYREKSMDRQTKDERSIYQSLARCALWDLMNHPSVVMWGIHNESHQFCPEYEEFVKMGHRLVDGHDWQQRPVTWAAWHPNKGKPHFEHADVAGFNEYRGAMDPFEQLGPDLASLVKDCPGKPLIILENGAWSKLGNRGPKDRRNTEDWQADLLQRQHDELVAHIPPLAGYTYWLLNDYRSRKPYTGNRESGGWSRMGLYDEHGTPKLARDVFRDLLWPTSRPRR